MTHDDVNGQTGDEHGESGGGDRCEGWSAITRDELVALEGCCAAAESDLSDWEAWEADPEELTTIATKRTQIDLAYSAITRLMRETPA